MSGVYGSEHHTAKMSADGNIVVFGHGNGEYAGLSADSLGAHVFHKNLTTGQLQVVDIQPDGSTSNNSANIGFTYRGQGNEKIDVSDDGSIVAFLSQPWPQPGTDLVDGVDVSGFWSVYVRDMSITSGTPITLANAAQDGTPSNENSYESGVSLSGDGQFVAFRSGASNLVDGIGGSHVYVKNLLTGEIVVASSAADGTPGNGSSAIGSMSFSADGRYLAFESSASNLVAGDTNNEQDIFVKDLQTGGIERVSVGSDGTQLDGSTQIVSISDDGSAITYYTLGGGGNFVVANPLASSAEVVFTPDADFTRTALIIPVTARAGLCGRNRRGAENRAPIAYDDTLSATATEDGSWTFRQMIFLGTIMILIMMFWH